MIGITTFCRSAPPTALERKKHVTAPPAPMQSIHLRIQRIRSRNLSGVFVISLRRQPNMKADSLVNPIGNLAQMKPCPVLACADVRNTVRQNYPPSIVPAKRDLR